jgi:hypothetical protein
VGCAPDVTRDESARLGDDAGYDAIANALAEMRKLFVVAGWHTEPAGESAAFKKTAGYGGIADVHGKQG